MKNLLAKKALSILIIFLFSKGVVAQTDIDSLFSGYIDCDFKKVKQDTSGTYYVGNCDSTKIYFWPKDKLADFKLFDLEYHLLLKGPIVGWVCSQLEIKGGRWVSYYPNGMVKTEGNYFSNNIRIGTWKHFYANGQLEKLYTIGYFISDSCSGTCMVGSYEEYFDNGQIKVSGLYKAECAIDTFCVTIMDSSFHDVTTQLLEKVPKPKQDGTWSYFKSNGELLKREYY